MSESLDISREILGIVAGQARPAGHQVASTTGNQSTPVGNSGDGAVQRLYPQAPGDLPDRDDRGPAMRHSANDFAWRPQDRFEAKAYRETVKFLAADGSGNANVDPNLCVNFWITGAGSITLAFAALEEPEFDDEDGPTLVQSTLVTLYVQRVTDAALIWPPGIAWSADIRDASGANSPFAPARGDQVDVFTLQWIPAPVSAWFGFVAGTRMS